jgi:hypothetical protein
LGGECLTWRRGLPSVAVVASVSSALASAGREAGSKYAELVAVCGTGYEAVVVCGVWKRKSNRSRYASSTWTAGCESSQADQALQVNTAVRAV